MRVFKYRSASGETLKRDLRSLVKNQIFLSPIEKLNDPFEAKVQINKNSFEFGKLANLIPGMRSDRRLKLAGVGDELAASLNDLINISRSWGVYSLSKSYKDELLWAYYADSHKGFCIEYDLQELMKYQLPDEVAIHVEYKEFMPTIYSLDLLQMNKNAESIREKLIGTKSIRWKHEDEIRVVSGKTGLYEYDFRALKAIYFGHRSTERIRRLAMRLLRGRGVKYYLMGLKDDTYELDRVEMPDLFDVEPNYKKRISPVADGVPFVDAATQPYEAHINKAIEIVRRDPYCERVTDAYLSGSKGTKQDPVFYVTYDRSDGLCKNFYLSRSQIESYEIEE